MSCGVRCSSAPVWLWLWRRPAAVVLILLLAWELLQKKKKKDKLRPLKKKKVIWALAWWLNNDMFPYILFKTNLALEECLEIALFYWSEWHILVTSLERSSLRGLEPFALKRNLNCGYITLNILHTRLNLSVLIHWKYTSWRRLRHKPQQILKTNVDLQICRPINLSFRKRWNFFLSLFFFFILPF